MNIVARHGQARWGGAAPGAAVRGAAKARVAQTTSGTSFGVCWGMPVGVNLAGLRPAGHGIARQGRAWQRHGSHDDLQRIRWVRWGMPMRHQLGGARISVARRGLARQGVAWQGMDLQSRNED